MAEKIEENDLKKCSKCRCTKLIKYFDVNVKGLHFKVCNKCREKNRKWNVLNNKRYYEMNKIHLLKYSKMYRNENKVKISNKMKTYYNENKDSILKNKKAYYDKNKDRIKSYMDTHKEYFKNIKKKLHKEKYFNDLDYIIELKIKNYHRNDVQSNRTIVEDYYINNNWIKNELIKNNNKCEKCSKDLKLKGYDFKDDYQFSVDRLFNSGAHHTFNCWIVCWKCNKERH